MLHKKQNSRGFTIVELLIVIVVIGILATLVIVTFTGIQQKARDSKRKTDIGAVQAALESYYSSNNTYPTVAQLQDTSASGWVATNLKGFDTNALQDPKGNSNVVGSGTSPTVGQYTYNVTPSGCDGSATPCTNFGIYAKLEGDGTVISKVSNN